MPQAIPIKADPYSSMPQAVSIESDPYSSMPPAVPIEALISEQPRPAFSSMPSSRMLPLMSKDSDPLTAELCRDVVAQDSESYYSAVIIPDETVVPAQNRAEFAKQLAGLSPADRTRATSPYLLHRFDSSSKINSLLTGEEKTGVPVPAGNSKTWNIRSDAAGKLSVLDQTTKKFVPASVYAIAEQPQTILIKVPLSHRLGQ